MESLEDHLSRCRCCFKTFPEVNKSLELSHEICRIFQDLTQLVLPKSPEFSSLICLTCHKNLTLFSAFRSELIDAHSRLAVHVTSKQENHIKTETEDTTQSISHDRQFFCDSCDFSSTTKDNLVSHMRNHLSETTPASFFCESCDQHFAKRFHLNAHVKAKHTEKTRNHTCQICSKAFFSAENLKKHVESHNEKDMPCEFCGKLFSCINNLRTHLYYHSEPKFSCPFDGCGKKFFMRKRLKAHVKTHANQKDFVCDVCEKRYFSQNDLNRHVSSIHQKLRFFCDEPGCSGSFSRREYYKKHVTTHHQDIGSERLKELLQKVKEAVPRKRI